MGTTNILDLNNRVSELEKSVSGGDSAQANKADIATEFNTTTAYTAGCFVYYGGKLYQFNADHAAGAWDPTDVVEANVTDQVVSNKAAIDELAESYPADKVMMSDGASVEADLVSAVPRTASGTTLAGLVSAVVAINTVDASKIDKIIINNAHIVTPQQVGVYVFLSVGSNALDIFQLSTNSQTFKRYNYPWSSTAVTISDISVTSWTIFYHGAEVS